MNPTTVVTDLADHRDLFRSSVAALPPGPLRDVLTAVAYARDAAARVGATAPSDERWRAVVAAAERAMVTAAERAMVTAAERAMVTAAERAVQEAAPTVLRLVA
jgi:hypothetical protein